MNAAKQKGAALVLTMILIAVLSVMTVSMMFLSQSEGFSTHNFRMASQARDAAEAGLNQAAHFLVTDTTYEAPDLATADADFNRNVYPVEVLANPGEPVVLSAGLSATDADVYGTYPDAAVQDAFEAAAQGTIDAGTPGTAGYQQMTYETSATLLSQRKVDFFAIGEKMIERWEIASRGSIAGIEDAEVEVSAILDRTVQPTFGYAAFGVSEGCTPPGLQFGGNSSTNSYDSRDYDTTACAGPPSASPTCGSVQADGGNVGTNGSMDVIGGSVTIGGTLSTPRTGVGSCAQNAAIDNPNVLLEDEDSIIELPQAIEFPDPDFPNPAPPLSAQTLPNSSTCPLIFGCSPWTPPTTGVFKLAPGDYGNIAGGPGGSKTIHLEGGGTYNINSLSLGSQVNVVIDCCGGVVINLTGCTAYSGSPATSCSTYMAAPLTTSGGSFTNSSYASTDLQILYGGPGTLQLRGNSGLAATVYAPNAHVETVGTTDFYGAVIGNTIDWTGTANLHYDRALEDDAMSPGPFMLQGFTWKKF
jgi:hypothetical protein